MHTVQVSLYSVSAACVVTSLRDGMNLVSYEYVICQAQSNGVLVLSEFAGAAQVTPYSHHCTKVKAASPYNIHAGIIAQALGAGCVRVNPYNSEDVAKGIHEALSMDPAQRAELHSYAYQYVTKFTAQAWAQV